MPSHLRCSAFLIGGGLALASLILVAIHGAHGAHAQKVGTSPLATEDYFSGTTHYAVPAKYNAAISSYSEKRNYSALDLMLFLPDFSPAVDHPEEMKRLGWHDQMTLLFEHGPHILNPDAQIAWMTNRPKGTHTLPEPAVNGCELYRTPLRRPGDVYVCPENGSKLVLSCTRKSDVPSPSCTVFENVRPDLSLIYHYSTKYAPDAVSIDLRIKALIASFAQPQPSTR